MLQSFSLFLNRLVFNICVRNTNGVMGVGGGRGVQWLCTQVYKRVTHIPHRSCCRRSSSSLVYRDTGRGST